MTDLRDTAADLAARFGLRKHGNTWGGNCPACGYRDAFKVLSTKGARPGLWCANGCPREALHDAALNAMGSTWQPPAPIDSEAAARAKEATQARALGIWAGSGPCPGTPAGRYLARRGIEHVAPSAALRFRDDCRHPEAGRLPAMVALVQDAAGQAVAVHRTYLTREGRKADASPVKASLGPVWGGAIRLDPAGPVLVIGEGIETSASAGLLLDLPAWAAISAGNLASGLLLPPEVREVVIAADPDPAGARAAAAAAARWRGEGRTVRTATPDAPGQDFNDILQARAQRATEAHHG